jgi:hypothetical protein
MSDLRGELVAARRLPQHRFQDQRLPGIFLHTLVCDGSTDALLDRRQMRPEQAFRHLHLAGPSRRD